MISLKSFTVEDWKYIDEWISDESELIQFAGQIFTFPINQLQIETYLNNSDRIAFTIEKQALVIGMAEIYIYNDTTVKLGRILIGEKSFRGQGIGKALIVKLINYSFNILKKKRAILNVYTWNTSAIKCYEKVGFSMTDKPIRYIKVGNEKWETIEMELKYSNYNL